MPNIYVSQGSVEEGVVLIRESPVPIHKNPQSFMTPQITSSVLISHPMRSCGCRDKSLVL